MSRVFISYKRNVDPDDRLASDLFSLLNKDHEVFIDKTIKIGSEWAKIIEEKLHSADYFIPLISKSSVESDMVIGEIETAYRLSKQNNGVPLILPILVDYEESLKYPLSAYINRINWAVWKKESDTRVVFSNIQSVMSEKTKPNYDQPDTKLSTTSSSSQSDRDRNLGKTYFEFQPYVERKEERILADALKEKAATIILKAPRYTGKRLFLSRIIHHGKGLGEKVALIDFHLFDKMTLKDTDVFFRQFCTVLTDQLSLANSVDDYWTRRLSPIVNCTEYVEKHILEHVDGSVILIIDEVEKLIDSDFSSDFFSMLRSWYVRRASWPDWLKLKWIICTSIEPYLFVQNIHQSPFNIGYVVELNDFEETEVYNLNTLCGKPFSEEQVEKLIDILGGHVFLISQAMQMVGRKHFSADELLAGALDDFGPFGDHLRHILFWLQREDRKDLLNGMRQVINSNSCDDFRVLSRLRGEGLVITAPNKIIPRCKLYEDYFKRKLNNPA